MKTKITIKFEEIEISVKRDVEEVTPEILLGMFIQAAKSVGIDYEEGEDIKEDGSSLLWSSDTSVN